MARLSDQQQQTATDIDLITTASHELKAPLTLMSGLASMLSSPRLGKLSTRQKRYVTQIERCSDRTLALVESLLSVGRLQHENVPTENNPIDIKDLLVPIVEEFRSRLSSTSKQKLSVRGQRNLPLVIADQLHVSQVLYNLLDNAVKYAPVGSTIFINVKAKGNQVVLSISNPQSRIKQHELSRIFERFERLEPAIHQRADSVGLGLYIVQKLVTAMSGTVEVSTHQGRIFFDVRLPALQQLELFDES